MERRLALATFEQMPLVPQDLQGTGCVHVWSVSSGDELLSESASRRLADAFVASGEELGASAVSGRLADIATTVFGVPPSSESLNSLREQLTRGFFSIDVQVVGDLPGTAVAAYSSSNSAESDQIYISARWLNASPDIAWISRVLLEETGHAVDQRLHPGVDSPGDEGEWFAMLVSGETPSTTDLRRIIAEDDGGEIFVDGAAFPVEFSNPGDTPPVVSLAISTKTVTENASASQLCPSATVSDTDSADFNGGLLIIRDLAAGDVLSLSTTTNNASGAVWRSGDSLMLGNGTTSAVVGSISGGTNSSALSILFSSTAVTPAVAQAALRAITFLNNSDAPVASRTLSVLVSDGDGGISTAQTLAVTVTAVNDIPVISTPATPFTLYATTGTQAEPSGAVGISLNDLFTGGRISDPDGTTNGQLGIAITTVVGASVLKGFWFTTNGGTSWTLISSSSADSNSNDAILLQNTPLTRLYFQAKTNQNAESLASVFTFRAWDLSAGAVSTSASQTAVSGATALSAESVSVTFTFVAGAAPVNAYPVSYSVAEDTRLKLSGLSVTLSNTNVATLKLSVSSGTLYGASAGGVTVTGSGTGVLTLQGTQTQINDFLLSSTTQPEFQSNADFNGSVTLGLLITDSNNLVDSDNVTITVTAVNDAPRIDLDPSTSGSGSVVNFTEGAGAVAIAPQATISDVDSANLASLTVTLTNRPDGNSVESLSLTTSAASTASGSSLVVSYAAATGVLTITGSASVATYQTVLHGVRYNNTSTQPNLTNRSITFTASDGSATSAVATATVTLVNTNNPPTLVTALVDQTVTSNLPFSFEFASGAFVDPENDTLTYRAALTNGNPLPGWISFDATTRRFTGFGPAASGTYSIRVSALDPLGQAATDDFTVTVASTLNGQSVASVSFPKVYELIDSAVHSTSGYYMEETNSFTTGTPSIQGTNFVFYQVGSTRFSGNNVPGTLAYIDKNGTLQEISGVTARPVKSPGNTVEGYYFWVDDGDENPGTTGDSDNRAFLLVVNEAYFQDGGSYNSSSDRVDSALNGYLDTATVSIADASATENAGSIQFTVTRSSGTGTATVFWATLIDAADTTSVSDFTSASGTLSFADGQLTATITVSIVNDSFDEQNETFSVTLSSPSSNLRLATATAIGTIVDDDSATVFNTVNAGAVEGGAVVFIVTRTGTADVPQVVSYVTSIGAIDTAYTDDFAFTQGTVTFAPGETTKRVSVQTTQDTVLEANETFTFTLRDPTNGATLNASAYQATGTIEDDESVVIYSVADTSIVEGNTLTFTISRSGDVATSQTINYATSIAAGDTTSANDFTAASGTITFLQGELARAVTVQTTADTLYEGDETLTLTISSLQSIANTKISAYRSTAVGTILDANAVPTFTIAAASAEEGNTITFTVTRAGDAQATQTVYYASSLESGDSAEAVDFALVSGNLSFAPGQFTKTFTVTTTENTALDGNRTFTVSLSNPSGGAVLGSGATALGTIRDDDGVFIEDGAAISLIPLNQWLTASSQTYAGLSFGFSSTTVKDGAAEKLRLSGVSSGLSDIPLDASITSGSFTLGGVDYAFTASSTSGWTTIGFSPSAGGGLTVTQVNSLLAAMTYVDLSQNPNGSTQREFSLAADQLVSDGFGGTTLGDRVTISTLKVNVVPVNDPPVANNDSLNVTRGGGVVSNIITTSGAGLDTDIEGDTLTIASIDGTAWASLSASADSTYTAALGYKSVALSRGTLFIKADGSMAYRHANADTVTQTFTYGVSDGNGGTSNTATVSIAVTDLPSFSIDDVTVNEAAGTITFTVTKTGSTTQQATVAFTTSNGTATAGSDYTATSGTLTFAAGDTAKTVTVSITNDSVFEGTETLNVGLSSATNATISDNTGVGTIIDDDFRNRSPVFTHVGGTAVQTYSLSYAENRSATDILGRVYATDADGDAIAFSITSNVTNANNAPLFAISSSTGAITLTDIGVASFANDFEALGNNHIITVAASDGIGSPTSIQVALTETDVLESGKANGDTASVNEAGGTSTTQRSSTVTGNVLRNDTGGDAGLVTSVRLGPRPGQGQTGVVGTAWRGNYGTLTLEANGNFTYVLDNTLPVVDALPTGGRLQEVFNYTRAFGGSPSTALLQIAILGENDSPLLLSTAITFPAIPANTALPEVPSGRIGVVVSGLMSPESGLHLIADRDAGAKLGFAITGADETRGTWWFSMNDGESWARIGQVSVTQGLLLPGFARLFFRPERGVVGDVVRALTLRAWDHTAGAAGLIAPVATLGSSLSIASATVSLRVDVPDVTKIDFDTIVARSVAAPVGNLLVRSSSPTERVVSNISSGSRITTLGSGSLRLLAPLGDLLLSRGGAGIVIVQRLRPSARLNVETSFGTVTFSGTGQLLSRHTPSQLMALRRSIQISGSSSTLTFTIKGAF